MGKAVNFLNDKRLIAVVVGLVLYGLIRQFTRR